MPMRTVWHAIFEWFEDGVRHVAYRGDTVDVPESVIDQYGKFGVFDEPAAPVVVPTEVAEAAPVDVVIEPNIEGGDEPNMPSRPKQAAPVKEWEDYAVALNEATGGEQGYTREDAEKASKQDLIAKLP